MTTPASNPPRRFPRTFSSPITSPLSARERTDDGCLAPEPKQQRSEPEERD